MPITGPSPAAAQARAASASTRVLPDPAGALITDTRWPSVSTDSAAAAWSSRSPVRVRCVVRVVRAAGQRVLQLRRVRAERARGLRAGHARRAAGACLGEHAFFHGQLRAGGVAHAAVPLVDAAPVGAQQAARHLGRLGCLQAGDRLELAAQGAVGEAFEQRGGRGRVQAGPGQDPAQVLDHIGAGPGALFLLGQRDRLLRRAGQLELGEDRAVWVARARGRVSALRCATPTARPTPAARRECARACPPSPRATARNPACRSLAARVVKFDACASCAISRWDGLRP